MKSSGILLCIGLVSMCVSCESKAHSQRSDSLVQNDNQGALYDLKSPSDKYFLPYVLEEISGLTFFSTNSVLAVDDEKGKVFEYDMTSREIVNTISFHSAADFEGVEIVDEKIYVLKSDGDIFEFDYSQDNSTEPEKYETDLDISNDTEGLGYDPAQNMLLIACKEKGEVGKKEVKGKAIYGFDLKSSKLSETPVFSISDKQIKDFLKDQGEKEGSKINFKPSAIAFHPLHNAYYVLSSSAKLLVVVDENYEVTDIFSLSPKSLHQPEGICFSPSGDMYISSEGDDGKGYILKYKMISK